jgi:hypothetical protein
MAETAAHLVDHVFPRVPVRQWVLSLHHALRYRLAYDARMVTEVLDILHMAAFDGVYAADDEGRPQFQALLAPDDEEIAQITATLAERITAFLVRRGLGPDGDPEEADPLSQQEPWLSRLYAAAVTGKMAFGPNAGKRLSRTGDQIDPESMEALNSPRCASVAGSSLHANVEKVYAAVLRTSSRYSEAESLHAEAAGIRAEQVLTTRVSR